MHKILDILMLNSFVNIHKFKASINFFKNLRTIKYILFATCLLLFNFVVFAQKDSTNTTTIDTLANAANDTIKNDSVKTIDFFKVNFVDLDIVSKLDKHFLAVYLRVGPQEHTSIVNGKHSIKLNGEAQTLNFTNGVAVHQLGKNPEGLYFVSYKDKKSSANQMLYFSKTDDGFSKKTIPLWVSIIPPLLAIILALIFKQVILSLFIGIWSGAFFVNGMTFSGLGKGFLQTIEKYILNAFTDEGHASIIVFSLLIGGMVAIISRNGGMKGVVDWLSQRFAKSARSSQFVTWLLGILIFFDDYANTLIVGNTMRSVTDRFRVSREKLAYIVDSTAAPIAAIAFITTWIGAELGYIEGAIDSLGINDSPYGLFLKSLTYSYYPMFTLLFILFLILLNVDFGPMHKAETRARTTGKVYNSDAQEESEIDDALKSLQPIKGVLPKATNAVLPILTVILGTIVGLYFTAINDGFKPDVAKSAFRNLSDLVGSSNSYVALLWSSLAGVTMAILLSIFRTKMKAHQVFESLVDGFKTMMPALVILLLAWSLAAITGELYTAEYLSSLISGNVHPRLMPTIVFLLAGAVAFATGSSWGTMAILYPLVLPSTYQLCLESGLSVEQTMPIFYNVVSVVLAGAVFGDHCSPISDTTILSSLASNCNHIDHVRTQLWYAITVACVSLFAGGLLFYYEVPPLFAFLFGIGLLFSLVSLFGKRVKNIVAE